MRLSEAALVLVGAVLVIAAFGFLDWYDAPAHGADSAGNVTFGKLHSSADQLTDAGSASAYFGWLGWALLFALILAGVAANVPVGAPDPCRVAGFLLGAAGAALGPRSIK